MRTKIQANKADYRAIFVAYGDCGTGGLLDAVIEEEGVERIDGPHCYAFYTGQEAFAAITDDDPTQFFLTDYMVRHFDRLIIEGPGPGPLARATGRLLRQLHQLRLHLPGPRRGAGGQGARGGGAAWGSATSTAMSATASSQISWRAAAATAGEEAGAA